MPNMRGVWGRSSLPPLVVSEAELNEFVEAVRDVVELMHTSASFWTDAIGSAKRAVNI
jgi:ornithine--oxo-acid transaminase